MHIFVEQGQQLHVDVQLSGLHKGLGIVEAGIVGDRQVIYLEARRKQAEVHVTELHLPSQATFDLEAFARGGLFDDVALATNDLSGEETRLLALRDAGDWPAFFLQAVQTPSILFGVGFLIIFFALFATALSKADLSFVLPAISSEVVINVAFANYFLHEAVSSTRWLGAVLISIGVILVLRSAPRTFEIASGPARMLKGAGQ